VNRVALLLVLGATGCSTAAQGFIASQGDYAAYRATRVGATFVDRLSAAQRYLDEHPDGRYKAEVRAFFDPAEELFYADKKGSKAGLESYLAVLPTGPHKEQVARRIGEIETAERSRLAEMERTTSEVEARVSGPGAAARARVRAELSGWLARLLDRATYAAPLQAAAASLLVPYSLSLPSPRCALLDPPEGAAARRCAKLVELPYAVEGERGSEAREATVEITLVQDARGVPVEATIGGPDLFLRLEETYRVKAVPPDDPAQRAAAAARAGALVKDAFVHAVSDDPACVRRAAAPAALEMRCLGINVTVRPSSAPGTDDQIVIVPLQ
jgi:hypothetical protein